MTRIPPRRFARLHDALIAAIGRHVEDAPVPAAADLHAARTLLSDLPPPAVTPRAWLNVRADGRVTDCNARAAALFALRGRGTIVPGVAAALARPPELRRVFWLETAGGGVLLVQATALPDSRSWHLVEAPPAGSDWLGQIMAALYGLTPREVTIALGLLAGGTAETIAAEEGRTLGTVRQAIKGLLAKMGVRSQAQAIARMATLAVAGAACQTDALALTPGPPAFRQTVAAAGPATVWRLGESGGQPLLFLHGALYGVLGRPQAAAEARLFGFDVIAPVRPGYGEVPLPAGADPVALAVEQAVGILDALGIGRAIILAHDVGTVYACAVAAAHPGRVAGLVAAPVTPPMDEPGQIAGMPPRHRLYAVAAQRVPHLMESLVRLGLRRVALEGASAIPRLVFAGCDHDHDVMADPAALPVLEHLHDFALEQDARGFIADMFVTNRDWSAKLQEVTCPVVLLHGARSRTVSLSAVRRMAERLPRCDLVVVEEAGHTLPLSHAALPLRAALRLGLDRGG
ncbi:alpha/beta fold hydrolase [Rubellimicrobium sp. CFH 75288]|uniref:alpha/beta fold hydrolase n=1 Tax=Rubellimicrobium sp. CFH 75288 TaxID=2697034 RepID=UPI001412B845|nr:alpha/beta fold hydrolase [Rubellimicrobium sp. CFH 75288]NAZ36298.1 alpha/beta fold hydrolase [Rubellimicrobium sp. CFH 75288]